jgi:hypothetical protein
MSILASFSQEDTERLFLTYKKNFRNYNLIKEKVLGRDTEKKYLRNRKSSIFFFGAFTFIIGISSAFSLVGDQMNSLAALGIIWALGFIFFVVWTLINYKANYQVSEQNKAFFDKFEAVAEKCLNLDNFKKSW